MPIANDDFTLTRHDNLAVIFGLNAGAPGDAFDPEEVAKDCLNVIDFWREHLDAPGLYAQCMDKLLEDVGRLIQRGGYANEIFEQLGLMEQYSRHSWVNPQTRKDVQALFMESTIVLRHG